jgi:hypothetical protein
MVKHSKGEHKGIRLVTSISNKESAELARKFLNMGSGKAC